MRSVNSYSKALRKDIKGRNWILVFLAFIAYLLIAVVPVLMNFRSFENVEYYAKEIANGTNALLRVVNCVVPVVMSVNCFGYLHDKASATVVHARPVTRTQLFNQSALSGFLLMMIPVVLTALLLLPLAGAQVSTDYTYTVTSPASIFTLKNSAVFILRTALMLAFVYAMSNLAAVIAGNRAIHTLLALFINGFPVTFYALVQTVLEGTLFGYRANYDTMGFFHPVISYFGGSEVKVWIVSLAVIAITYAVSLLLYKRVRLERVGDACFFPAIADLLCILITFLFSVALGLIFSALLSTDADDEKMIFMLFTLIASVIGLIITRMTADSSTHVFNRKLLRTAGIFAVCIAVFFAVSVFDVTGYQKRVPEVSEIDSVEVCTMFDDQYDSAWPKLSTQDALARATALHTAIVFTNGQEPEDDDDYMDGYVNLCYHLKNGRTIERWYSGLLITDRHPIYDTMENLYNNPEYRKASNLENYIAKVRKTDNRMYIYPDYEDDSILIRKKDHDAVLEAFQKDYQERSFSEQFDIWRSKYNDSFSVQVEPKHSDDVYNGLQSSPSVDKNLARVLKEKGYF